jgi:ssDNA-binding Zn-finger/Zn-ribbon topoisomerase 1
MSDTPNIETADRSGSDAPTCSAWREAPETVKEWRDTENMRPDPRAKRMVHHSVKMERERNALAKWAQWAAPILERATLIVIDHAMHRFDEIAVCQACIEQCPVDFETLDIPEKHGCDTCGGCGMIFDDEENADVMNVPCPECNPRLNRNVAAIARSVCHAVEQRSDDVNVEMLHRVEQCLRLYLWQNSQAHGRDSVP